MERRCERTCAKRDDQFAAITQPPLARAIIRAYVKRSRQGVFSATRLQGDD